MYLLSVLHVILFLYFYISTFRNMYEVSSMTVFCSSLISCFPSMLVMYCLSDSEMVPVALVLQVSFLLSHSTWEIFMMKFLYYKIFWAFSSFSSSYCYYYYHYHHYHHYHRLFITSISANVCNYKPILKKSKVKCY